MNWTPKQVRYKNWILRIFPYEFIMITSIIWRDRNISSATCIAIWLDGVFFRSCRDSNTSRKPSLGFKSENCDAGVMNALRDDLRYKFMTLLSQTFTRGLPSLWQIRSIFCFCSTMDAVDIWRINMTVARRRITFVFINVTTMNMRHWKLFLFSRENVKEGERGNSQRKVSTLYQFIELDRRSADDVIKCIWGNVRKAHVARKWVEIAVSGNQNRKKKCRGCQEVRGGF